MKKMKKRNIVLTLIASFYLFAAIFGVGFTASAAGPAVMDSTLNVANATRGDANYTGSTSALVDQVVKFQVWYHNTEAADSGRDAQNLNIRVALPTTLGQNHVVTSTVGGINTNTVTRNASVTTQVPTRLAYIPGTAVRRYNSGTNANPNWVTASIPDSIVTSGYTIPSMNPCWYFQESIYIQARVNASYLSIDKTAKIQGGPSWIKDVSAAPGNTIDYMINVKNEGNTVIHNVVVRDAVPTGLQYVAGSARLINGNNPNGVSISDTLVTSGVNIGNYNPGSNALVRYSVTVPATYTPCGNVVFTNTVAATSAETSNITSTAVVRASYDCPIPIPPTPTPTPNPNVVITGKGGPLTTSGPAEAAAGAAGLTITGGAGYVWLRSKKALLSALTKIK
jgi:uncharacterized repeat protein (TIGR01451 family)